MNMIALMAMIDDPDELDLFCKIQREYDKKIFNYLYALVKDFHETEDLCQEVFFKIANNISIVKALENNRMRSYVYKIAQNTYRDYCKKLNRMPKTVEANDVADTSIDIESLLISEEEFEDLIKIISGLPETYRDILIMYYVDELDMKSISRSLNVSIGTVKSCISRGTAKLLERIRNEHADD